jgi:hypothetical protein
VNRDGVIAELRLSYKTLKFSSISVYFSATPDLGNFISVAS